MGKRVQEETLRTVIVAAAGFLALYFAVPEWARDGVMVFGALYCALVVAIDADVRALFLRRGRAKSASARRAAT